MSWEDYFFGIVHSIAERSVCLKKRVGAIIVKDNQILSHGYNGPATGIEHCEECIRKNLVGSQKRELCPSVHAELNAIIQAAKQGVSIKGAVMYIDYFPCSNCLSCLINADITEIMYEDDFNDPLNKIILKQSDIKVMKREINGR